MDKPFNVLGNAWVFQRSCNVTYIGVMQAASKLASKEYRIAKKILSISRYRLFKCHHIKCPSGIRGLKGNYMRLIFLKVANGSYFNSYLFIAHTNAANRKNFISECMTKDTHLSKHVRVLWRLQ